MKKICDFKTSPDFCFEKKNVKKSCCTVLGGHVFFFKFLNCVCLTEHTKLCSQRCLGRCCMLLVMKSCRPLMSCFNIAMGNAMPCHVAVAGLGSLAS